MTDISIGTPDEARQLASDFIDIIARDHPNESPIKVTAAMAMALGAMVASLVAMGSVKQGQAGGMLRTLCELAEEIAADGLEAA